MHFKLWKLNLPGISCTIAHLNSKFTKKIENNEATYELVETDQQRVPNTERESQSEGKGQVLMRLKASQIHTSCEHYNLHLCHVLLMKLPNRMSFPLFKAIFWHTALPNQVHRHYTPGNPNQVACNMTMHTKDDNMLKKTRFGRTTWCHWQTLYILVKLHNKITKTIKYPYNKWHCYQLIVDVILRLWEWVRWKKRNALTIAWLYQYTNLIFPLPAPISFPKLSKARLCRIICITLW